jgi:hypothetical protein
VESRPSANDYGYAALMTHPPDQRHGLKPKLRAFCSWDCPNFK